MVKYSILVQYDNMDNIYIASIPELQGCTAHGDTPQKAVEEINVVLELWLETARENGVAIPEPVMYARSV